MRAAASCRLAVGRRHRKVVGELRPTTVSSRHACSRTAPSPRNNGRARRRPGNRSENRRRDRHPPSGSRSPSRPSDACPGSSPSGKWPRDRAFRARGASTRRPNVRALAISSAWESLKRNASGAKIGASRSCRSSGRGHRLASAEVMRSTISVASCDMVLPANSQLLGSGSTSSLSFGDFQALGRTTSINAEAIGGTPGLGCHAIVLDAKNSRRMAACNRPSTAPPKTSATPSTSSTSTLRSPTSASPRCSMARDWASPATRI